ncbi:hypothetical protein HK100_010263 [Physocladia obscura]|uniref:Uncharacterized protein n=1 Tax=Physocladia obscura TaxID=109957 RepID=A0AAD5XIY0_9FUNG|nr:hypothetical protein HK100_010263 [Physocladia obscura]
MRFPVSVIAFSGFASLTAAQASAELVEEALIWGIPLYQTAITGYKTLAKNQVGFNTFIRNHALENSSTDPNLAPNVDTLYSQVFLDLYNTGVEITAPVNESSDRYLLLPFYEAYTNYFASASRRNYPHGSKFLVYGPNSPKVKDESIYDAIFTSPTDLAWLVARTEVKYYHNSTDLAIANAIESTFTVSTTESVTPRNPAILLPSGVLSTDPLYFWKALGNLVTLFPPTVPAVLDAFVSLGLSPTGFNSTGLDATTLAELTAAPALLASLLTSVDPVTTVKSPRADVAVNNNWFTFLDAGNYSTDYSLRAALALAGGGANIPADAVYYEAEVDIDFDILNGNTSYVIDVPSTGFPNNAFWSIIAYYKSNASLIYNTAEIYGVGTHTGADLVYTVDDTIIRILLQPTEPTETDVNWLPTPNDLEFTLITRVYQPTSEVIANKFPFPPIRKFNTSDLAATTEVPYGAPTAVLSTSTNIQYSAPNLYSSAKSVSGSIFLVVLLVVGLI